jgi:hypothetical protein
MVKTGVEVSEDQYTVKKAYDLLTREETEGCEWVKDVWNPLIPSKMSMLGWRLFQSRLPTKENLLKRGVRLTTSSLCVGGCGGVETESHLFFNCPTLSVVWGEVIKWLRIPVVLPEGGFDHLSIFMGLGNGCSKTKEKLGVIWFVAVYTIWKTRNAMIFNWMGFE